MDNASDSGSDNLIRFTPEEQAEFDAWDRFSDEAWGMIDWCGHHEGIARDSEQETGRIRTPGAP